MFAIQDEHLPVIAECFSIFQGLKIRATCDLGKLIEQVETVWEEQLCVCDRWILDIRKF